MFIIGTAGHIDHGKSSLIIRLTGIDPDRLPEEKARGMTIDLGFAYYDTAAGDRIGIVDVPGHERFVRNMIAGAGGIDAVIMVVRHHHTKKYILSAVLSEIRDHEIRSLSLIVNDVKFKGRNYKYAYKYKYDYKQKGTKS